MSWHVQDPSAYNYESQVSRSLYPKEDKWVLNKRDAIIHAPSKSHFPKRAGMEAKYFGDKF